MVRKKGKEKKLQSESFYYDSNITKFNSHKKKEEKLLMRIHLFLVFTLKPCIYPVDGDVVVCIHTMWELNKQDYPQEPPG